jgi:glycosyltransferase involved in cell wall biosynthesis
LEFVTLKVLATTNCILWCHGIEVWNINYLKKYKEKLSQVSTFVCVSNFTSNFLIEFGISKKKILIIHNAVDVNFFKPCFSNSSKQAFELLTVSRLSSQEQYKGHDLVLNSLASLKARKNIDFRYTIVGDGDDRWRLQQFCNDLGLQSQVEFVGKVSKEELLQYYRRCTAFIMPSYVTKRSDGTWCGEGLGIVYLEAMACAKPVIASLKGGQTEVVVDGMTGLLVEPTVEAVTFAIKNLYDKSNEDLEMMGVQGRAVVEENFSISYFRKAIQELLNT